jgi:hypothetical protein
MHAANAWTPYALDRRQPARLPCRAPARLVVFVRGAPGVHAHTRTRPKSWPGGTRIISPAMSRRKRTERAPIPRLAGWTHGMQRHTHHIHMASVGTWTGADRAAREESGHARTLPRPLPCQAIVVALCTLVVWSGRGSAAGAPDHHNLPPPLLWLPHVWMATPCTSGMHGMAWRRPAPGKAGKRRWRRAWYGNFRGQAYGTW